MEIKKTFCSYIAASIICSLYSMSVTGAETENIASPDFAFANTSLSYGDNGYQEDPLGMIRAFDGNPYTSWHPALREDSWLGQLFPEAMAVTGYSVKGNIEHFKIQASHDGIAWQTLDTQREQTISSQLTYFTIPEEKVGAYQYYRLYTIGDNYSANINMLELYGHRGESSGGVPEDVTMPQFASASSNAWVMTDTAFEYLPNLHTLAFDNISGGYNFSENTYWRPVSQNNEWLAQSFTRPQRIVSYTLEAPSQYMAPEHWLLQASIDGSTWLTLDERQNQELGKEKQSYEIAFEQQGSYPYYRLYFPSNVKPIGVSEVELLAAGATAAPVPQDDAVMVVIRDAFGDAPWYEEGSHGGFVMAIAQGHYNAELDVDESVEFRTSNINDDRRDSAPIDLSEEAFKADVINMSSSSTTYDAGKKAVKSLNDYYPQQPLKITSAGNASTVCTAEAAELGRQVGLSASALEAHFAGVPQSEWEHYYKACDMTVVAAIDAQQEESWIVVAGYMGDPYRPQKPLGILKDRGVVAPYKIDGRDGTSFSAPYVSALAAMILQRAPELTASEVAAIIFATADDLGEPGVDEVWGHGRVNPARAMQYMDEQGYGYP
ncbi:hypothetical protein C9J03_03600 [Photobacterium gaetbulicola]|uniref:F5/8 type C domain-containing protein n=1 Tax=Photobacterium gaetbulicola Gung47 TaxID=658445 RepID=A0A0C5WNP7_9GAMM|nr:S8 family serine peptidase [Photobacterium gaetbulicola]AJR06684.1 hypothetical protein H744_1c1666 [Photobacterium gaetbulicola Gung47]PSU14003.1 hypothetical protein C9J03_03600 [Photobacterium gaetbulicola]